MMGPRSVGADTGPSIVDLLSFEGDPGSAAFVQSTLRKLRTGATSRSIGSMFSAMGQPMQAELPGRVLFYDGVCAMCNGIVKALLRLDREQVFAFAPLQGETAARVRELDPEFPSGIETLVYWNGSQLFVRSRAAALAMAELPYPTKALSWFRYLPTWLTDPLYNLIARIRYRLFGRYNHCPVPPEAERARFLP